MRWHLLEGDALDGPTRPQESDRPWFRHRSGKCKTAQSHSLTPVLLNQEKTRKRKTQNPSQEWSACRTREIASTEAGPPSPSPPGPVCLGHGLEGHTTQASFRFLEVEVCDLDAGGTGLLRGLCVWSMDGHPLAASLLLSLGVSLYHKNTTYTRLMSTHCLTLT